MNKALHSFDPDLSVSTNRRSNDVDKRVGQRLRLRRQVLGLNAEQVASAVGITHQQLQKYECAQNRVSAGRLFQLAHVLATEVSYFFDDGDANPVPPEESIPKPHDAPTAIELAQLIEAFSKITCEDKRHDVIQLTRKTSREE